MPTTDPDQILYGDITELRTDPDQMKEIEERRHYKGLVTLDMSLTATQALVGDMATVLGETQVVIDRMTGWDQIDSNWYADANDPDHPSYRSHIDEQKTEREWQKDTAKRWKIGMLHHAVHGLVWAAHNNRHQPLGSWNSGSGETVITELYLGDLIGEVAARALMMSKIDQRIYPPGLRAWFGRRDDKAAREHLSTSHRMRQRA